MRCPVEKCSRLRKTPHVSSAAILRIVRKSYNIRRFVLRPLNDRRTRLRKAAVGTPHDGRALSIIKGIIPGGRKIFNHFPQRRMAELTNIQPEKSSWVCLATILWLSCSPQIIVGSYMSRNWSVWIVIGLRRFDCRTVSLFRTEVLWQPYETKRSFQNSVHTQQYSWCKSDVK